jgi:multidrug efflux pump subunit AcrA (membrane-fusion protein)/YHS domain-containing protein
MAGLLMVGGFVAGRWQPAAGRTASAQRPLYYTCPMHPQFRSDQPGDAPCCGMRLVPVWAGHETVAAAHDDAVYIAPDRQQLMGIRFAAAEITSGVQVLRAVGRIAYDKDESVVIADVLEHQADRIQLGQRAIVSVPFHPDDTFHAVVDYVYPRLDVTTRTLKVRMKGGMSGHGLLTDTFVNVEFELAGPPALTVPADAVLDLGTRQVVFVDRGAGYLAPQDVQTGRRLRDRIEIRRGLRRGERVAAAGAFLIDSESRLRADSSAPAAHHQDPVCGRGVDERNAYRRTMLYRDVNLYFCSEDCYKEFVANPEYYGQKAVPTVVLREPGDLQAITPATIDAARERGKQ